MRLASCNRHYVEPSDGRKPVLIGNLTTAFRADDAGLLQDWQLEQDGLILASQQHCQCQNKEW